MQPPAAYDNHDNASPALALLRLLIAADLAFIVLHMIDVETGWLRGSGLRLSLEAEGGMPEVYQYLKQFWIAACMAAAFYRTRIWVYASWTVVFVFLMCDDAGQIHERTGAWLGRQYDLPAAFGLRPDDTGELIFAAAVGASVFLLVGLAVWRGGQQSRRVSRDVLCLIFVLAFLGVAVDTLHVIAYFKSPLLAQLLLLVEDGGEMIVISVLTAYAFHVASHRGLTRLDLWATVRACLAGSAQRLRPQSPSTAEAADSPRASSRRRASFR